MDRFLRRALQRPSVVHRPRKEKIFAFELLAKLPERWRASTAIRDSMRFLGCCNQIVSASSAKSSFSVSLKRALSGTPFW